MVYVSVETHQCYILACLSVSMYVVSWLGGHICVQVPLCSWAFGCQGVPMKREWWYISVRLHVSECAAACLGGIVCLCRMIGCTGQSGDRHICSHSDV